MTARLIVICGPMFAGKSTALLKAFRGATAGTSRLFKPAMDTRYDKDAVVTHDGIRGAAMPIRAMPSIPDAIRTVFLDEVQFMEDPWFEGNLPEEIFTLLSRGISVWTSGLDMDAWGVPFAVTAQLLAMADEVFKLKSACHSCGDVAGMTTLLGSSQDRVTLGGSDTYAPSCRRHWQEP